MTSVFGRWVVLGVVLLAGAAAPARGQMYPGGFGGYGWGGWGRNIVTDPNSTYLQGMGYYLKNEGEYKIEQQKANKLEIDNVIKWNKALREANRLKRIDDAKREAKEQVRNDFERRELRIKNGELLNEQLDRLVEFPAAASKQALTEIPLSADVLREINFQTETESLTLCLDELTTENAWPGLLRGDDFSAARKALSEAVDAALAEDISGTVTDATRAGLDKALDDFRKTLDEKVAFFSPEKNDAQLYLIRLTGMMRLLEDAEARPIVKLIETYKQGTMLDLVVFMHSFNLRFGPAKSERQVGVYQDVYETFTKIPTSFDNSKVADTRPIEAATRDLATASKDVFKNLAWGDLEKQAEADPKK